VLHRVIRQVVQCEMYHFVIQSTFRQMLQVLVCNDVQLHCHWIDISNRQSHHHSILHLKYPSRYYFNVLFTSV
jgi:hypothetical protein